MATEKIEIEKMNEKTREKKEQKKEKEMNEGFKYTDRDTLVLRDLLYKESIFVMLKDLDRRTDIRPHVYKLVERIRGSITEILTNLDYFAFRVEDDDWDKKKGKEECSITVEDVNEFEREVLPIIKNKKLAPEGVDESIKKLKRKINRLLKKKK